jgi:mycothiol synthase
MDETRYRLREFLDRDFGPLTRISNALRPERHYSEEEYRRWDAIGRTPPMVHRAAAVEERATGEAVAFGEVGTDLDTQDPRSLWVGVSVDPDHQGRGVGRHLADWADAEATRLGATTVWAMTRADQPRALRFPERRGFRDRRHQWESLLDLPAVGYDRVPRRAEALEREGIRFTTLAAEGADRREVREAVHGLFNAVLEDEPRLGRFTPTRYDQFVELNLMSPGFLPEAFFLARTADQYVGVSNLERFSEHPEALHQILTGTRREFRGRGIATELKRRGVEYGQEHGYRSIRTTNDSRNQPIWAINEKLGFRRQVEFVQFEKTVTSAPTS